jgi:hypothetical protein
MIPVAILTTSEFDATTVQPDTVCFGDSDSATERSCEEVHGTGHIEDVDGDGMLDMLLHYYAQKTGIEQQDTEACLSGQTNSGVRFRGCDSIRVVGLRGMRAAEPTP